MSGASDIYRDRASLGHLPVLRGQTLMEEPYRLQTDADTSGLWNFDENINGMTANGLTTSILDKSAAGHLGTITGATWGTTGPWGSSLAHDGSNDVTTTTWQHNDATFTAEVVAAHADIAAGGSVYYKPFMFTGGYGLQGFMLGMLGGSGVAEARFGHAQIELCTSVNTWGCESTAHFDDALFHYICTVCNMVAGTLDLYVDGVSVAAQATGLSGTITSSHALMFGYNHAEAVTDWGAPTIAQVRISAVARPAAEILTNAKLMGFA
jgi:hypothetical protein